MNETIWKKWMLLHREESSESMVILNRWRKRDYCKTCYTGHHKVKKKKRENLAALHSFVAAWVLCVLFTQLV
jgi:hypothetical protein